MESNDHTSSGPHAHAEPMGIAGPLRNVGICAHIDAGKTTLSERVLHLTGRERHVGRVDEGTSVMDWMSEERERGITITAAATRVAWRGTNFNIVDTPGHVDFTVEVERCMRVLDGAILVLDASKGVEPQTETVWRQVQSQRVPVIAFANKCERPGADVLTCAASVSARLGARALVVAYPIGGGDTEVPFAGVVDLVRRSAWAVGEPIAIPDEIADEVDVLRAELVDAVADLDEGLFEVVCEGNEPSADQIAAALRRLTRAQRAVPLLCGAALLGHGVPLLLDAITGYLPSPGESEPPELFASDRAELGAEMGAGMGAPLNPGHELPDPLLLAFKVHSTLTRGRRRDLNFVRIYRGSVRAGTRLWNGRTGVTEEVESVLRIHSIDVEHIDEAHAGDVVALSGLTSTGAGDTLTAEGAGVRLEPARLPHAVLGYLVEPRSDDERLPLRDALDQLEREDPSLRVAEDRESGQWLLEGMGELHLEIALARLGSEFGIRPRVGAPRVAFRESIRGSAMGSGSVDRGFGERWGKARVEIELEPLADPAAPLEVVVQLRAGVAAGIGASEPHAPGGQAQRAMLAALRVEADSGPLAGHPLLGARICVVGAESEAGSDLEVAWEQAAVAGLREALKGASTAGHVQVLEPTMAFVVETPVDVSSGVIGDLNSRHANLDEVLSTGEEGRRVTGTAPLSALVGYSTALRSLSRGRATFSMRPSGLAEVSATRATR